MQKRLIAAALALIVAPVYMAATLSLPADFKRPTAENYRGRIAIENLFAGRGTAGEEQGLPLVWFRLRNVGDFTVDEVRVHVNFLDEDGAVVHEADFMPVHRGAYGIRVPPLEPGAVWQMSNIRYYMPQGVPHTWRVGAIEARIESVRFHEE